MFYEVWIERDGESYFFRSHENAMKFAEEEMSNWATDEVIAEFKELEYLENIIYLTERSFED